MSIRLLALDLDGTILDRNAQLPEANRLAVQAALAAGIEVILVTGRSWRATRPYYEALGLSGPAICYLGALVVAGPSGRVLHYRPLEPEAWAPLKAMALAERLPVTACVGTDQAVTEGRLPPLGHISLDLALTAGDGQPLTACDAAYATCRASDFATWEEWNPYTQMAPDLAPCGGSPVVVAVYGASAAHRVLEAFPEGLPGAQFDLTDRVLGETVLHIWHQQVDKGLALAAFCRSRGIDPAQVCAVGDAPMDISMIRFAGVGVAVPDGHPALKAAAAWVATPVEAIGRLLQLADSPRR